MQQPPSSNKSNDSQSYPTELPGGYIYIGIRDVDEVEAIAPDGNWHTREDMGQIDDTLLWGEWFNPQHDTGTDCDSPSEYVALVAERPGYVELSNVGESLKLADWMARRTTLTRSQAEAYALREIHDLPREDTAQVLDRAKNTIDNQLRFARDKAEKAEELADLLKLF